MVLKISPDNKVRLLGVLSGANMNSTADQTIVLDSSSVIITQILVTNASASLTLAAGGFYTAASKGGSAIVAAAQVYSALTNSTLAVSPTIGVYTKVSASQVFLSLTVAQGSAATADIYVLGIDLT